MSEPERPILVTGSHRSGTTWVGKMIAKSHRICYIREPFNKFYGPGVCNIRFDHYFPYVTEENEEEYVWPILESLKFKYHLWEEIKNIKTKGQLLRCFQDLFRFQVARVWKKRPLFKDPIAFFSSDWLERRFRFQNIVLIRHPAAFVSSVKRLGWNHPFEDFLKQPLLMKGPLKEFNAEIESFARFPRDIIDQASLLWKIIYGRVLEYKKEHPDWIYIRHEDISRNPADQFKMLFGRLGLPWTDKIEKQIRRYSNPQNPKESPKGRSTLKLNSRKALYNWKDRLSSDEILRIKKGVEDLSSFFYSESEW